MTMTREDEHEFYARPENQEPKGPARRRTPLKLPDEGDCERPASTDRAHVHRA